MALVPSHQFYPRTTSFIDSFHSSVVTKCYFFRYASSIPPKNQSFHAIDIVNSSKTNHLNPEKRFNFSLRKKKNRLGSTASCTNNTNVSFCSFSNIRGRNNSWLDNWNETHKVNKLKRPQEVLNYRNDGYVSTSDCEDNNGSRTDVSGSTMERIVEKLKKFGFTEDVSERKDEGRRVIEKGSIEDIFYVEEGMLPNSRGGFSQESPLGDDNVFGSGGQVRFPWEKPEEANEEARKYSVRQKSRNSLAELTLPESELRRLRNLALRVKNKMKVGGAGVTKEIVERIHEKWKTSEVARLKIEGPPALNMRRMHEILERKTGGLVIWRSGTSVTLYRGVSYVAPSERPNKRIYKKDDIPHDWAHTADNGFSKDALEHSHVNDPPASQAGSASSSEKYKNLEALPEVRYEDEVDKLLDGLGPRYTDWPGSGPLPIDADLLPGVVPGYQPPFRLLPYGVRSTLGMKEGTALRRLARVLPPHFALGRSRQHQGLAAAMLKIWERSSVVKIAVKRGVQLTTSERMAEDIKKLTGGMLLSRNKDFLVFYRGKDFLSPDVAKALLEKEMLVKALQDEEEQARLRASASVTRSVETTDAVGPTAGTLGETLDADARWGKRIDDSDREKVMREADILRHANLVRKLERKLAFAERKIRKAERALGKVEESLNPAVQVADPDSISDEERFMFRKLGLRMKAFLLLGRRGVFDGTVENMHLHWKYRELVKIMVKAKNFEQVKNIALSLEAESGGVLVSVDKVSKGYAIIVFRGKDYKRPSTLRPRNLLTKRKALARSIELQRRQALLDHISTLQTRMNQLRSEIEQMAAVKEHGDEELYDKLDSAYLTEDEDSEEEGEEAYLEIYDSDSDAIVGSNSSIDTAIPRTNFPYNFQDQPKVEQL